MTRTILKSKLMKRKITINILILASMIRMKKNILPSTEVFSLFGATSTRVTKRMPNQVSAGRSRCKN